MGGRGEEGRRRSRAGRGRSRRGKGDSASSGREGDSAVLSSSRISPFPPPPRPSLPVVLSPSPALPVLLPSPRPRIPTPRLVLVPKSTMAYLSEVELGLLLVGDALDLNEGSVDALVPLSTLETRHTSLGVQAWEQRRQRFGQDRLRTRLGARVVVIWWRFEAKRTRREGRQSHCPTEGRGGRKSTIGGVTQNMCALEHTLFRISQTQWRGRGDGDSPTDPRCSLVWFG